MAFSLRLAGLVLASFTAGADTARISKAQRKHPHLAFALPARKPASAAHSDVVQPIAGPAASVENFAFALPARNPASAAHRDVVQPTGGPAASGENSAFAMPAREPASAAHSGVVQPIGGPAAAGENSLDALSKRIDVPGVASKESVDALVGASEETAHAHAAAPPAGAAGSVHRQAHHHFDGVDVVHGHKGAQQGVQVPPSTYFVAAVLLAGAVVIIYGPRGPSVVAGVLIYLGALSTMTLSVKWVLSAHEYSFPMFVTVLHLVSGAIVTGAILMVRKQRSGMPFPVPNIYEFWVLILPIAIAMVASIGANNMALVHCSAAFTEIIGSSTCLITIAMVVIMGMPFDKWLILPALLVATGCALSITGEVNFSLVGMLLCFTANAFRSLKASLQQKLMTTRGDKFDPCVLLFWICMPSIVVMGFASLGAEGLEPYRALAAMEAPAFKSLIFALAVSCVNATILNLAQLLVTKDLGAVGSQLAAQAKSVLVVLGSMVLFADPVTLLQVFGFMQVLMGVFIYSRMDQKPQSK